MIDSIMTLILREAMTREGKDRVANIYKVMDDLENRVIHIIENIRLIERRKEEDKNKNEYFSLQHKDAVKRRLKDN